MLIDTLFMIYLGGIAACLVWNLYQFSQGIKVLQSWSSSAFMSLEVLKRLAYSIVWPITVTLTILQIPFTRGTVDDMNDLFQEHLGIEEEDNDRW